MDGQQLDVADADRIVARSLTPLHDFSYFKEGMVAWGLLSLPLFLLCVVFVPKVLIPTGWALVTALGIGGAIYFQFGIYHFAAAHAFKPFVAARRAEAVEALKAFAVRPLVHWDTSAGHGKTGQVRWATGVAWDGEFLYVLERGVGARIPLSMVREWRWSANRAGTSGWVAAGGAMQVMQAKLEAAELDARDRQVVEAGNGLHLTVRSVDKPTWQFQTSDEAVLRRWAEILRQAFERRASESLPGEAGRT